MMKYGEDVWKLIFLRCDYASLGQINQTCRMFNEITNSSAFWVEKCDFDGIDLPPIEWRRFVLNHRAENFDFHLLYRKQPFNRNLLPVMTANTTWRELEAYPFVLFLNNGCGFRLERRPKYCQQDPRVDMCLATSFGENIRYYEINFEEIGIDDWIMDKIRPKITVTDLFNSRGDSSAYYLFQVHLLEADENFDRARIDEKRTRWFDKQWDQWQGGQEWEIAAFEFENYPVGIRKIGILSCGIDRQNWYGHYGAKFGNATLEITFPEMDIRYKEEGEFQEEKRRDGIRDQFFEYRHLDLGLRRPGRYRYRPDSP